MATRSAADDSATDKDAARHQGYPQSSLCWSRAIVGLRA